MQVKYLSTLTPAEVLFALQGKSASLRELLKVTFMDLLLKQVLKTIDIQRNTRSNSRIRNYQYVCVGKNFNSHRPLPHETIFLAPFQRNKNVEILFRHVVKLGYENAKSEAKLHAKLSKSPNIASCYKSNFLQSLVGGFSITTEGIELRTELNGEISLLERQLPIVIAEDQEKAQEILKTIHGNVFLIATIDLNALTQIDATLFNVLHKEDKPNNYYDSGCSGHSWQSFDHYSENFDSSCSGDSGCSSSGCSGCGGCGGD